MRKQWIAVILFFIMMFVACSSPQFETSSESNKIEESITESSEEVVDVLTVEEQALLDFKSLVSESGAECAVAYVGYMEGSYGEIISYLEETGIIEKYPFLSLLSEDRFIQMDGSELYVVISVGAEAVLIVNEYEMGEGEEFYVGPGEQLYSCSDGLPVLLRGNISDILPNFQVVVETIDGQRLEYNPSLSLADGKLNSHSEGAQIYDFTPYDELWAQMP